MPLDIVWENISKESGEVVTRRSMGFVYIAIVCFLNTLPLLVVSALANLGQLTIYVQFLGDWQRSGQWGDWTVSFSLVRCWIHADMSSSQSYQVYYHQLLQSYSVISYLSSSGKYQNIKERRLDLD